MLSILALSAALISPWDDYASAVAAVKLDYANYGSSARYLDFSSYGEDQAEAAQQAWKFWQPHLDRGTSLAHATTRLAGNIYRVDIENLGWGVSGWRAAIAGYPYATYAHDGDLLIVRADWILAYGADASRVVGNGQPNGVYYSLLFGGKTPANKTEWLKAFDLTDKDIGLNQAQVIDRSGVAFGRRLHIFHPDSRDWFETLDSRRPSGKNDPALGVGQFKSDASELIVEMPKVLDRGGYSRVRVQAYLLTDGAGKRLDVAANDIVEDHRRFANRASVRTPGSCVLCHSGGLNGSPSNTFVEFLRRVGQPQLLLKDAKKTPAFDALYLGNIGKVVRRANEDFAEFCLDYVGEEPKTAVANWSEMVAWYDEPIDLAQAAREVHCTPEEMRLSLGHFNAVFGPQVQYLDTAGLAHGGTVSRSAWEDTSYRQCVEAFALWRQK